MFRLTEKTHALRAYFVILFAVLLMTGTTACSKSGGDNTVGPPDPPPNNTVTITDVGYVTAPPTFLLNNANAPVELKVIGTVGTNTNQILTLQQIADNTQFPVNLVSDNPNIEVTQDGDKLHYTLKNKDVGTTPVQITASAGTKTAPPVQVITRYDFSNIHNCQTYGSNSVIKYAAITLITNGANSGRYQIAGASGQGFAGFYDITNDKKLVPIFRSAWHPIQILTDANNTVTGLHAVALDGSLADFY